MKRVWMGIGLLAGSWLFGLGQYHQANWLMWLVLTLLGVACFTGVPVAAPGGWPGAVAAIALLPAVGFCSWPYRVVPILLLSGWLLCRVPVPRHWVRRMGGGCFAAALVLLTQGLAWLSYQSFTARSHELPDSLARVLYWVTRALSLDTAISPERLAVFTMRQTHLLGPTWELLVDPVTLGFAVGGLAYVLFIAWTRNQAEKRTAWALRSSLKLVLLVLLWLPIRAGLLVSIIVNHALRTGYDDPLELADLFWNHWLLLAFLIAPVLFMARTTAAMPSTGPLGAEDQPVLRRRGTLGLTLIACAAGLLTVGLLWDPAGKPKQRRVLVNESNSEWERTDRPFDTEWYGKDAGYNYACIYDFCSRFYEMGRLTNGIHDAALRDCDVLMLKVPTQPYTREEVESVQRFVEGGGGVLLVGEHTDVFRTGSHLNQIARAYGFRFRYDCLFGVDTKFRQLFEPSRAAHPILQHMPPLDFAVSCSIAVDGGKGRAVIQPRGMWSLPAEYHASNFYPPVEKRADARYGSFIQLWATRSGRGRVLAFTDSTIFSNFSTFEPGKAELMLGMLEWLNRRHTLPDPRPGFTIVAAILLAVGAAFLLPLPSFWFPALAAGLLGWAMAWGVVCRVNRAALPLPQNVRPMVTVVNDRTVCDSALSHSGFIQVADKGFGIFEQWTLRLGYFISRRQGDRIFDGDLIMFLYPNAIPAPGFAEKLEEYVRAGGKVLVMDSALNEGSRANSLLYPFGLELESRSPLPAGTLELSGDWPEIEVTSAVRIKGGQPFAHLGGSPVGTVVRHGKGTVTVVGFGSRFTDDSMGGTADAEPSPPTRRIFDTQYKLIRAIVEDTLVPPSLAPPEKF